MPFGNAELERQAIESTYDGLCTISEFKSLRNQETYEDEMKLVPVYENMPCALSQATLSSTQQTDSANVIDYDAKLFISPDITIKAGSQIRVIQNGMDYLFEQTGEPFKYPTHQEVKLKRTGKA